MTALFLLLHEAPAPARVRCLSMRAILLYSPLRVDDGKSAESGCDLGLSEARLTCLVGSGRASARDSEESEALLYNADLHQSIQCYNEVG